MFWGYFLVFFNLKCVAGMASAYILIIKSSSLNLNKNLFDSSFFLSSTCFC